MLEQLDAARETGKINKNGETPVKETVKFQMRYNSNSYSVNINSMTNKGGS